MTKILVVSDTHVNHPSPAWGQKGNNILRAAKELATTTSFDIALHLGDIVEPDNDNRIEDGLAMFAAIPAQRHLWVAGNNDIEFLHGHDIAHYQEHLARIAQPFGVHLLDKAPITIDGIGFAGNYGSYDLSLWELVAARATDSSYPETRCALEAQIAKWYRENLGGIGVQELFDTCQTRLHYHIQSLKNRSKIVVATHTVPDPSFVVYGKSESWDMKNAWMGWDDHRSPRPIANTPNLVLQLCGHTHRYKKIERPNSAPLINVSGDGQPHIFEI